MMCGVALVWRETGHFVRCFVVSIWLAFFFRKWGFVTFVVVHRLSPRIRVVVYAHSVYTGSHYTHTSFDTLSIDLHTHTHIHTYTHTNKQHTKKHGVDTSREDAGPALDDRECCVKSGSDQNLVCEVHSTVSIVRLYRSERTSNVRCIAFERGGARVGRTDGERESG